MRRQARPSKECSVRKSPERFEFWSHSTTSNCFSHDPTYWMTSTCCLCWFRWLYLGMMSEIFVRVWVWISEKASQRQSRAGHAFTICLYLYCHPHTVDHTENTSQIGIKKRFILIHNALLTNTLSVFTWYVAHHSPESPSLQLKRKISLPTWDETKYPRTTYAIHAGCQARLWPWC